MKIAVLHALSGDKNIGKLYMEEYLQQRLQEPLREMDSANLCAFKDMVDAEIAFRSEMGRNMGLKPSLAFLSRDIDRAVKAVEELEKLVKYMEKDHVPEGETILNVAWSEATMDKTECDHKLLQTLCLAHALCSGVRQADSVHVEYMRAFRENCEKRAKLVQYREATL